MKKRIAFLIALLMILCLTLAGCAQRSPAEPSNNGQQTESHDGGGVGNPDSSEPDTDVEPTGDDTNPGNSANVAGSEYFVGMSSNNEYRYNINGVELSIRTDLSKYIDGKIFRFKDLAYDLGWHAMNSDSENNVNNPHFFLDDENKWEVGFRRPNDYDQIAYTYTIDSYTVSINFDRLDLNDDSIQTYTCNKGGYHTANMAEILVITYLLENQTENGIDVLEGKIGRGSDSYYHVHQ